MYIIKFFGLYRVKFIGGYADEGMVVGGRDRFSPHNLVQTLVFT